MPGHPSIVVGIDGSCRGDDALAFATVLAEAIGGGVLLVHASAMPPTARGPARCSASG